MHITIQWFRCKFKSIPNCQFVNLLVHRNSWVARLWMALFFRWTGLTHLGPLLVSPRLRSQSANQAMWQLQLNGLEIRLRLVRPVNSSKAPGVTQLIKFPYRDKLWRLFRPRNIARFTTEISFSESSLAETIVLINYVLMLVFPSFCDRFWSYKLCHQNENVEIILVSLWFCCVCDNNFDLIMTKKAGWQQESIQVFNLNIFADKRWINNWLCPGFKIQIDRDYFQILLSKNIIIVLAKLLTFHWYCRRPRKLPVQSPQFYFCSCPRFVNSVDDWKVLRRRSC